jgi:hypothetical protein
MTSTPTFEPHPPINRAANQIRLLSFKDETPVSLNSRVYDLEDCPPFAALSYPWGSRKNRQNVEVNGLFVDVQNNLREALSALLIRMVKEHAKSLHQKLEPTPVDSEECEYDTLEDNHPSNFEQSYHYAMISADNAAA